jgi:hypothetical protein
MVANSVQYLFSTSGYFNAQAMKGLKDIGILQINRLIPFIGHHDIEPYRITGQHVL